MGDYPIVRRPKAIFYHGGVAGVAVGGSILPSLQVKSVAEAREDPWYCSADDRFCSITTDIIQAWHNALVYEEALGAGARLSRRAGRAVTSRYLQERPKLCLCPRRHLGTWGNSGMGAVRLQGRPDRVC